MMLLVVLKRVDDRATELEKMLNLIEERYEKIPEIITPPNLQPEDKDEEKGEIIEGVIGIIIDDFGYRNDKVSDGFLKLNAKMTYAVIPGHSYSSLFGRKAVDAGYEVVVHMPLENTGKTFGEEEFVLLTSMKEDEMIKRLNKALDEIPTAIGMNNHQGSKASADSSVVISIAKVIKERNLFFIDSRTTAESIIESTMESLNIPTARRNVFLDNDDEEEKIIAQLMELAQKASELGFAIGIGHVKPKTLSVLEKYIPILKQRGFKFEFVSKMLH
jgi:hypothetical protein